MTTPTVSEQTALRIAAALERLADAVEQQGEKEPVSFPLGPFLEKKG